MENTENYINNEQEDEFEQAWQIKDDGEADWAFEKVANAQAEIDRCDKNLQDKIAKMQMAFDKIKLAQEKDIAFFTNKLKDYLYKLDIKPTKAGSRMYNLPSGKVTVKPQQPKYTVDDTAFVAWLKNNGHSDLVKCTESGQWGELKKNGVIVSEDGATVLTADGELVGGVVAELREDVVKVEVL